MAIETISLPAGQVLTVTAVKAATLYRMTGAVPGVPTVIAAAASASVGPFAASRVYAVNSEDPATVALTTPDPVSDGDTLVSPVLTTPDINGGTVDGITSFSLAGDIFILSGSGAPVDYTDGDPAATGEGTAGPGSIYIRTSNGKQYQNGGTKAQPVWKLVTSAT